MKALLEFQLTGSFNLVKTTIAQVTDAEWRSRAYPKANVIGFTLWHSLRTLDWALCGVAAGEGELADEPEWRDVKPAGSMFGAGVPAQQADSIALAVARERAAEYEAALRERAMRWFRATRDEDFERVVDLKAPGLKARDHMQPAAWPEISDLSGIPLWQFLARPAVSHVRVHHGEVTAQLESLRSAR